MPLAVGDLIGGTYRIERLLGEGGMARVYEVSHSRLPKKFALKLMIQQENIPPSFLQRFRREAEVMAKLRHPHIVEVVDWNETPEGLPYLVMEYLEGEDLAHFLARTGTLQPDVALAIIYQIGQALQTAHEAGIVHRDLKPGNVFLDKHGPFPNFVRVLDFGIAKVFDDAGSIKTSAAALMGTPAYMSPEQARGLSNSVDGRSDQFALAVMLYEMLSGKKPFCLDPEEQALAIIAHIIIHEPPPLSVPRIGPAVQRAMSKDPKDRYPSIKEFLSALGARRSFGQVVAPATLGTGNGEVTTKALAGAVRNKRRLVVSLGIGGAIAAGTIFLGTRLLHTTQTSAKLSDIHQQPRPIAPVEPKLVPTEPVLPASPSAADVARAPGPQVAVPEVSTAPKRDPIVNQPPETKADKPKAPPRIAVPTKKPELAKQTVTAQRPVSSAPLHVMVYGANPIQEKLIRDCWTKEVKPVDSLPHSYQILLQRSGVLHVMEAPDAVRQTDFSNCLRQNFYREEAPEAVTISVRGRQ